MCPPPFFKEEDIFDKNSSVFVLLAASGWYRRLFDCEFCALLRCVHAEKWLDSHRIRRDSVIKIPAQVAESCVVDGNIHASTSLSYFKVSGYTCLLDNALYFNDLIFKKKKKRFCSCPLFKLNKK